jgi:S1-C subfamily serine protease
MTRRQFAVPLFAALLGSAVTAAALTAAGTSTSTGPESQQRGLLAFSRGSPTFTAREIYDRSKASVVAIRARSVQPVASPFEASAAGPAEDISTGSGFVLDDDGHIVTTAHVVSGVTDVQVTFSDLRTMPARVVGKDEETDLAVLRVDPGGLDLRPLEFGDSDSVESGDRAVTLGNPSGFGATAGTGTVSDAGQELETPGGVVLRDLIRTDAVIEPATSGGPLIGADGRVIGISSSIAAVQESGVGYAVSANTAKDVLSELKERHKLIRPYLGIRGRTIDAAQAAADGGASAGVVVDAVYPGGPAAQAGLQGTETGGGDVIEAIDGRPVTSLTDLLADVDRRRPGDTVRLSVLRDGSRGVVNVVLAERPASLPAG